MAIWADKRVRSGIAAVLEAAGNDHTRPITAPLPAGIDLNALANTVHEARNRLTHGEAQVALAQRALAEAEAEFSKAVRSLGIRMRDEQ